MRQTVSMTSTYSSDEFGICSSLYELGGMVVMHDASGCNSTYTTHDEPRWYEMDSMIYISAISEMEAVMGDDDKFINDVIETARIQNPKFIALIGAPIPYMIGTDFEAIAHVIESETGIPCIGFPANGMNYYTKGISMAIEALVKRFVPIDTPIAKAGDKPVAVNLLGLTPLDFPWKGTLEAIQAWLDRNNMKMHVSLSMGCSFAELQKVPAADVNLVLSSGGLEAARYLKEQFGIPYVVGVPYGCEFSKQLAEKLSYAAESSAEDCIAWQNPDHPEKTDADKQILLIGEAVTGISLASAIQAEYGVAVKVADPLSEDGSLLRDIDLLVPDEDDVRAAIAAADVIIADPLYRPLAKGKTFIDMPHTAFSGRIYEKRMPVMIDRALELTL